MPPSKTRHADLYLCRETQRKEEYNDPADLIEICEARYGWAPKYAREIVEEMWKKLYAPATEDELKAKGK